MMRRYTYIYTAVLLFCISAISAFSQTVDAGTYTGDAFLGKASGGSIKLNGNVTITSQITVTGNLTIDLNGYMLAGNFGNSTPANSYLIRMNGGGATLNIINTSSEARQHEVQLYNGSKKIFTGGVITNRYNHAIALAGSSASSRGNCNISNCKIVGCSTSGSGGAINIFTYGGKLKLENVDVSYNYAAQNGGGIYGIGIELINTRVQNNICGQDGGGIHIIARSATNNGYSNSISGNSIISHNSANQNGGGISSRFTLTINGSQISGNFAVKNGGGLYGLESTINITNNSVIDYNYADGRGGGFYLGRRGNTGTYAKCVCTLSNSSVTNNAALEFGGGGQVGMISAGDNATLTITNGKINNNRSLIRGAGGLHVTGESTLTFNSGEISYNQACEMGGGIHSSRGCDLNLNGGEMKGNVVYGKGGAINMSVGCELTLNGTDIIENQTFTGYKYTDPNITPGHNSSMEMTYTLPDHSALGYDSSIRYEGYGGGISVDAGTCTIQNNSIISGNHAAYDGGGIALIMIDTQSGAKVPSLTMVNGSITENLSERNGGGVYIMKNSSSLSGNISATINGGSIISNYAKGNGGGIYMETGSRFTMEDGVTLSKNLAGVDGGTGSGGAVYVSEGAATIKGGDIVSNMASVNGGAIYVNGNVTVSKGNLTKNLAASSGGSIYVQSGTVTMNNISMTNNMAGADGGGLYLGDGSLTIGNSASNIIQGNTASNGGGACIANGTLGMEKCTVSGNTANLSGGGIYVANMTAVTINLTGGGIIDGNKAQTGGGLAVGGAITLNFEGSLQNNEATNGGGIYLFKGSALSGATLNFRDGFIRRNLAKGNTGATGYQALASNIAGWGGGIFLDQGTTFQTDLDSDAKFGFYGNRADQGGDDIFANGNGTTVNLPDIAGMELADFDVPTAELYWVEDYATGDTGYDYGTKIISTPGYSAIRYQTALETGSPNIGKLLASNYSSYKNKYFCLSLGYELYYVILQKKGLEAGDVAIFNISYVESGTTVIYRKVKFIGKGADQTVSAIVALPPKTWTFTEDTKWSWKYETAAPVTKEITKQEHVTDPIVFTNVLKSSGSGAKTRIHDETFRENRMRPQ